VTGLFVVKMAAVITAFLIYVFFVVQCCFEIRGDVEDTIFGIRLFNFSSIWVVVAMLQTADLRNKGISVN
jgi:hypothetical protein